MMLSLQQQRQVQKVHIMPPENDFGFPPPLGMWTIDWMATVGIGFCMFQGHSALQLRQDWYHGC